MNRAALPVACVALVALAWPWLPRQLDDFFISLAYAREWAATGALTWDTGERVEGFSNFSWVVWLRVAIAAGVPPGIWAKLSTLACGLGVLVLFHRLAPRNAAGAVLVGALALWAPLAYWSAVGLETPLAGLLAAAGWGLVFRRWAVGMWLLALLTLTRPEGTAYLLLGALVRARELGVDADGYLEVKRRPGDLLGLAAVGAGGLWHAGRVAWFGDFWPTPYLVKVVAVQARDWGPEQILGDLAVASGVILAVIAACRLPRVRDWPFVLAPLVLHAALLLDATGDWMGMGRLLLPGLLATAAGWLATAPARPVGPLVPMAAVVALAAAAWVPGWPGAEGVHRRDWAAVIRPDLATALTFETPFDGDLEWMAWSLPEGARVQVGDVGMLSLFPDIDVLDSNGLVDRAMAEHLAAGGNPDSLPGRYAGEGRVDCVRSSANGGEPPVVSEAITSVYTRTADLRFGTQKSLWWCLPGEPPPVEVVQARWAALFEAVPDQPWVRWQYARALADAGRWSEATELVRAAPPNHHWALDAAPGSLQYTRGPVPTSYWPGRGFGLYFAHRWTSRPVTPEEARRADVLLDVDEPGAEGGHVALSWEPGCDAAPSTVVVHAAMRVRAPTPTCEGVPLRLVAHFLNDSAPGGPDRNVYVGLDLGG